MPISEQPGILRAAWCV